LGSPFSRPWKKSYPVFQSLETRKAAGTSGFQSLENNQAIFPTIGKPTAQETEWCRSKYLFKNCRAGHPTRHGRAGGVSLPLLPLDQTGLGQLQKGDRNKVLLAAYNT